MKKNRGKKGMIILSETNPAQELARHLNLRRRLIKKARKDATKEEVARAKALERYQQWRKEQMPAATKAAEIIYNWAQNFWSSEFFQQILVFNRELSAEMITLIRVSNMVDFRRPSQFLFDAEERRTQYIFLDIKQKDSVFVQDAWKYGKHHLAKNPEDLTEVAEPPVLIQVAKDIKSGVVWKIILKELDADLKGD